MIKLNLVAPVTAVAVIFYSIVSHAMPGVVDFGGSFGPEHKYQCSSIIPLTNGRQSLAQGKFEEAVSWTSLPEALPTSPWKWTWRFFIDVVGSLHGYAEFAAKDGETYKVKTTGATVPPETLEMLMQSMKKKRASAPAPLQAALMEANKTFQIAELDLSPTEPSFEEYVREKSLNGTEIKSVERLNSLSGDTKYSFLQHGAFIFSTDAYAIWLPRTADRLIVCLPEDSVKDGKLDGRQAKKALFDFATKANQMRFLKCENILIRT